MYPMLPFSINPLADYHSFLRMGARSGYPNQMLATPHPAEMSTYGGMRPPNLDMFRYSQGRNLQMNINPFPQQQGPYGLPYRGWQPFHRPANRWPQSSWGQRFRR